MDVKVIKLDGKAAGKVSVSENVFGLEPREDILQRMVRYQLAKRRQGTQDTKQRSEIARTGAKMFRQKGTGRARHHAASAPQFRGGGKAHGPNPRSHAHELPKKFRALALRHALSAKAKSGDLVVVDDLATGEAKTSAMVATFGSNGWNNALLIGGAELDKNFALATQNIPNVDVLPIQGINVY